MFDVWKLRHERWKTARLYEREIRKAKQEKKSRDEMESLCSEVSSRNYAPFRTESNISGVGSLDSPTTSVISNELGNIPSTGCS